MSPRTSKWRKSKQEMAHLVNPRPDLVADAPLWARLLLKAYPIDGQDPEGLFQALHGLRCAGASLRVGEASLVLEAGEIATEEYAQWRTKYLLPHKAKLVGLLAKLVAVAA